MKRIILLGCLVTWLSGCLWAQESNKNFEKYRNREIGKPVSSYYAKQGSYGKEVKKSGKISKYVIKHGYGCKFARIVDTSKKGMHTYNSRYTAEIEGIIIGWKYLSPNPKEICLAPYWW